MHYANGRAASIGDLVRGKGYNLKHEFTGVLIFANPGATACNAQVATITLEGSGFLGTVQPSSDGSGWKLVSLYPNTIRHTTEYGQLDAFVAIDPLTGEVLPAEGPEPAAPAAPVPPHVPATAEPAHVEASAGNFHAADPNAPTSKVVEIAPSSQVNQGIAQPEPAPPSPCPPGYEIAGGATQQQS